MAYEERVTTPGKVNSLISFFEKQSDESPKSHLYTEGCHASDTSKQDLVDNYFSEGHIECKQLRNGSATSENAEVFDNTYGQNLQTIHHQSDEVEQVQKYQDKYQNQQVFEDASTGTGVSYELKNSVELRSPSDHSKRDRSEKTEIHADDKYQSQPVFEEASTGTGISYELKNSTEPSSPSDHSEHDRREKTEIQIDYKCQSNESSEDEQKAVEDKLYDLKLSGQESETGKIVYLGNDVDEATYAEYQNIQVIKQQESSQYEMENGQYDNENMQHINENMQHINENRQHVNENGQYDNEDGQCEDDYANYDRKNGHCEEEYGHSEKESSRQERESLSSEETERIPPQEIGFVQTEQIEHLQEEDAHCETQMYAFPYELLPRHLKGFTTPTIFPSSYFEPDADATRLKKAMKGLGTDEATVIEVITHRSVEQRFEISNSYENLFQKSLVHELEKELSGNFERVITSLMTSPYEFLASQLRKAVKGAGTDEDALIEILCVYEDQDIIRIKDAYDYLFKKSLKDDIYEDTSGDFRKILLSILAACREDPKASPSSVAAQLCETDSKGKSTLDLDTLRTVMVSYTRPFLYSVFSEYEELAGKTIGDLIKAITSSGDTRNALLALYQGIVSLPVFFGKELNASFKGLGTKDSKLIRIIVSRAEFDLEDIKEAFYELYHKNLEKEVQKETSGDYKNALVALIVGNSNMQESESNH